MAEAGLGLCRVIERFAAIQPLADFGIRFAVSTFEQNMGALDKRCFIASIGDDGNQFAAFFVAEGHSIFFHVLILP